MVDVDYDFENFYKYFAILLLFVVIFLVALNVYLKNKPEEVIVESNIINIDTTMGNFTVEIFLNETPITAGNFKTLVEKGYYDGVKFHRVIEDFIVQTGDPITRYGGQVHTWGTGGPGYTIEDEFVEGLSNVRGTLSMANSGPNTGGSQFFINIKDNTFLDYDKPPAQSKHPVFGRVIEGMDVIDNISKVDRTLDGLNRPREDIDIIRAYVVE